MTFWYDVSDPILMPSWSIVRMCAVVCAFCCSMFGCSRDEYVGAPIEARVVDDKSGGGLEGVHVVAAWQVKGGWEGGNIEGYLEVRETVTDTNGMFRIPGWGPKANPWHGGFGETAPRIMLFKPGYEYRSVANKQPPTTRGKLVSDWDGKTIALSEFVGPPAMYYEKLGWLRTHLHTLDNGAGDHWREIPRFLCAGARFERKLAAEGAPDALPSYNTLAREKGLRCQAAGDE